MRTWVLNTPGASRATVLPVRRRANERTVEAAEPVAAAVAAACRGETPLVPAGARVVVACSGGADSTALAAAFAAFARAHPDRCAQVSVGHVDHGLRDRAGADALHVRALAERLGVPFALSKLSLGRSVARLGLEAAAREGRYAALAQLAREAGASVVATAHTRRDQAETLLLRLARGAGPSALAGARRRRLIASDVALVRPLLDVPREATEALCEKLGLAWLDDPHNSDEQRLRTRVRRLLPMLARELNPRLEEALAGAAELLAEEDALVAAMALEALERARRPGGLDAKALRALPRALLSRCLLQHANASGARPERRHLDDLCQKLAATPLRPFALHVPGAEVRLRRGLLTVQKPPPRRSGARRAARLGSEGPAARPTEAAGIETGEAKLEMDGTTNALDPVLR